MNETDHDSESLQWVLTQWAGDHMYRYEFIGGEIQIFLYGLCLAVFAMSPHWASSEPRLKAFLLFTIVLNAAYTILLAYTLTRDGATQIRDLAYVGRQDGSIAWILLTCCYIMLPPSVQIFYASRTVRLIRNRLTQRIWLAIFAFVFSLTIVGAVGQLRLWVAIHLQLEPYADPGWAFIQRAGRQFYYFGGAFIDLFISATLSYLLRRNVVGFNTRTDSTLRRLSRAALATGTLTSVTATVTAIIDYITFNHDRYWNLLTGFPLPSVYCLSMFWTLDLRARLRHEKEERDVEISIHLPQAARQPQLREANMATHSPESTQPSSHVHPSLQVSSGESEDYETAQDRAEDLLEILAETSTGEDGQSQIRSSKLGHSAHHIPISP